MIETCTPLATRSVAREEAVSAPNSSSEPTTKAKLCAGAGTGRAGASATSSRSSPLPEAARSAETLSLIRRGDQGGLERSFSAATSEIGNIVDDVREGTEDGDSAVTGEQLDTVTAALTEWRRTDAAVRRYIQTGNFGLARLHTVGDGPDSSARAYTAVDTALVDAITTARNSFRDDINTAQRVLGFTGTGILLLTVFAVTCNALMMRFDRRLTHR